MTTLTAVERIKVLRLTDEQIGQVYWDYLEVWNAAADAGEDRDISDFHMVVAHAQFDKLLKGLVEILETPYDTSNNPVGPMHAMGIAAGEQAFAKSLREALGDEG